jgi:hypothetical protein
MESWSGHLQFRTPVNERLSFPYRQLVGDDPARKHGGVEVALKRAAADFVPLGPGIDFARTHVFIYTADSRPDVTGPLAHTIRPFS